MRQNTMIAIVLIAIGIAAFAYQGINFTTREKAIDLGALQVTTERTRNIPLPPIVGAIALICGVVILARGTKRV